LIKKPTIKIIAPTTIAILAFNLGPPGAFINPEKIGFIKAAKPKRTVITPTTIKI
jgi:hypothetical protein